MISPILKPIPMIKSKTSILGSINKIPGISKPGVDVKIKWYTSSFPSNMTFFIDRANRATLVDNMEESRSVEKRILSLEKKTTQEEQKTKKVTFKEEPKKKTPKDPFDLEGLQKVLKSMSNEMVEIKKQVAKSSKKPFRSFRRNQTSNP